MPQQDRNTTILAPLAGHQWVVYAALTAVIVAGYCGFFYFQPSETTTVEFQPLPPADEPLKNRIAVLDSEGRIWIVDPDTAARESVTDETLVCGLPTWSPDGKYLSFLASDRGGATGIYAVPAVGGALTQVIRSDDADLNHFDWSPDSRWLAYRRRLSHSSESILLPLDDPSRAYSFERGKYVLWDWSEDSASILWQSDGSISTMRRDKPGRFFEPEQFKSRFRAPTWSSADGGFVYTAELRERTSLVEYAGGMSSPKLVFRRPDRTSLVASPDYSRIALLNFRRGRNGVLYVIKDGKADEVAGDRPVQAVFWSPDSRLLAIWSNERAEESGGGIPPQFLPRNSPMEREKETFWIVDPERGTKSMPVDFIPTKQCLDMSWVFSQFKRSHSLWSPDSRYLLVASEDPHGGPARVWRVSVSGDEPPMDLGEGVFATWTRQ